MAANDNLRNESAWWEARQFEHHPHEIMVPHIKRLLGEQAQRYFNFHRLNTAYEYGPQMMGWDSRDDKNIQDVILSFNYARGAIETVISKTVKSAVTPMPLTTGATWLDRDNAEKLGTVIDGEFRKNHVEELLEDVVTDGYVLGNGFFYVPHGQGEVRIEYVPCEDIVVDEAECRYRSPRSIYIRFMMDRDKLLEIYGEGKSTFYGNARDRKLAIHGAAMMNRPQAQHDRLNNQVEVWLGFHLRSGEEADDGKFSVCIENATLEFSPWNRDRFPLAGFVPFKRRRHYHGLSMLADFVSIQREHDKVSMRIQLSNERLGGTHLVANRKANVDIRDLNNGQGTLIEYDDTGGPKPIDELHPSIANPQVFEYRNALVNEMMQIKGIPSMTMTGQPPEGLHDASGKALELAEEQSAERLIVQQRAKDRALIDLAWLVIEEAEAITEEDDDYTVNVRVEGALKPVRWKDALLARDEFTLELQPAGDLAKTPAARFDQLMQMFNAKAISTDEFKASWFMPDLKAQNDLDLSDSEIIQKVLTTIVKKGKAIMPEPFDNLQLCVVLGRKFYNLCRVNEVEEPRMQLLRDYVSRAVDLQKATQPPPQAQAPVPQGNAPVPGAPPQAA